MPAETLDHATAEEDAPEKGDLFFADRSAQIGSELYPAVGLLHLLIDTGLDEQQTQLAKSALARCARMVNGLEDIATMLSLEAGTLELARSKFMLPTAVRTTVANHVFEADRRGLRLTTTVAEELRRDVIGDRDRFTQVVTHLIRLAIHACKKGTIAIAVSRVSSDRDDIELCLKLSIGADSIDKRAHARLERLLSDDGVPEAVEMIWSSVCCSVSRNLARLMDGDVGIETTPADKIEISFTARVQTPVIDIPAEAIREEPEVGAVVEMTRVLLVSTEPELTGSCLVFLNQNGFAAEHESDRSNVEALLRCNEFDIVAIEGELPTLVSTIRGQPEDSSVMRMVPVVGIPTDRRKLDGAKWLEVLRRWASAD